MQPADLPETKTSEKTLTFDELNSLLGNTLTDIDKQITKLNNINFNEWKENRELTINSLTEISSILEKVCKDTSIVQTTGGSTQIVGGILAVVGLCTLNPVLFASGIGVGVAGGVTSLTGALVKFGWDKSKQTEVTQLLQRDLQLTSNITDTLKGLSEMVTKLDDCIKQLILKNNNKKDVFNGLRYTIQSGYAIGKIISSSKKIVNTVQICKLLDSFNVIVVGEEISKFIINGEARIFGYTIFEAGSTVAKAFTTVAASLNIVFGVFDIIFGVKGLVKGSKHAQKIANTVNKLKETQNDIIDAYTSVVTALDLNS